MQYHTLSLVEQAKKEVHVVAFGGSSPLAAISHNDNIHLHCMPQFPRWAILSVVPRVLLLVYKALFQLLALLYVLLRAPWFEQILLQTPPCIPTFAVCKAVCLLRGCKLVIDWHNFGYTLLALSLPEGSRASRAMVAVAERYEKLFGRWCGDANLCVTQAMQRELGATWGVKADVLYDKPPQFFQPLSIEDLHGLFVGLRDTLTEAMVSSRRRGRHQSIPFRSDGPSDPRARPIPLHYSSHPSVLLQYRSMQHEKDCCALPRGKESNNGKLSQETLFTRSCAAPAGIGTRARTGAMGAGISLREDRPALIVSSTSWTPDEDFGILLKAARTYDAETQSDPSYPRLMIVITGKGPMREAFRAEISAAVFSKVAFRLAWLAMEDYPRLVSAADLGVSLHTSSSGLDLPMKAVDMLGCGVPVCSANYDCIEELVRDGENGRLFRDARELADQFKVRMIGCVRCGWTGMGVRIPFHLHAFLL